MPVIIPTLPCQVDGLKTIYVCNRSICFEFENAEQLEKSKKNAALVYKIKPAFTLLSRTKKPVFGFRSAINNPHQFIIKIVNTMTTQTNRKRVPIVNYLEIIF